MASNQSLLEQMIGAALQGGGLRAGQGGTTPGQPAPGASGNLGDILGSLFGGGPAGGSGGGTASRTSPSGTGGFGDILGSLLGGATAGGNGTYTQGAGGSSSTKSPSGSAQPQAQMAQQAGSNDFLKYGGMAVIGMLAYNAFKKYQAQQADGSEGKSPGANSETVSVPPSGSGFHPAEAPGGADALSGVLVKAMVAATQADGVIDEDEQRRLVGRLDQLGIGPADRRDLQAQLTTPVDPREIVNAAASPEAALQIYAASVLAVAVDTPAERRYLDGLATALSIDPGLKAQVEQTLGRS